MEENSQRTMALVLITLLSIGLIGCSPTVDVEYERELLFNTDVEFSKASVDVGTAEAFYRYLADDALLLPSSVGPVEGKDAIREFMSSGPEIVLRWQPVKADVSRSADLGYTWGTYWFETKDAEGNSKRIDGKYLNVWKKQPDGTWKVLVDIGNQSSTPTRQSDP